MLMICDGGQPSLVGGEKESSPQGGADRSRRGPGSADGTETASL